MSKPTEPTHRRRTVAVLRFLAVASIVVPVLMLCTGGYLTWHQQQYEAADRTARTTDLIFESTSKLFQAQLLATDQTRLMIGAMDDNALIADQSVLHARLQSMLRYLPHLRTIFVVSAAGRTILDGDRYPAPAANDLRKRDYYNYFRNGGAGLFVGSVGKRIVDERPFFPLAIARPSPDGNFSGVIAASVNPLYFERVFQQVLSAFAPEEDRSIALRRPDGRLLVRSRVAAVFDETAGDGVAAQALKSGADSGQYSSDWMGERRLVVWRRLHDVDMAVFTSVSLNGVLRGWARTMLPYFVFGLCAALSLFLMTLVALRRTLLAEAAEGRAAQERYRREQVEEAARQSQKMEALGKLTGGVAHDFNNLLAVIQGSAELAKTRTPDKLPRLLDNILHAAQRGSALTRQLLSFSRSQALAPRVMDPHAELPRMMDLLKPSLRGDIRLDIKMPDNVWLVEADQGEWEIALLNVAVNARDAMPDGGQFNVVVENVRLRQGDIATAPDCGGDFVKIMLHDTGTGIPADVAARAFEPFFTTKEVGRGTGLGLSQVYGFARQAGGAATIAPDSAGGTTLTLYLPRSEKPIPVDAPRLAAADPADRPTRRILLVEDNQEVAAITTEIIGMLGHHVVHVDRARKALDVLMGPGEGFHLLITDIVMPGGMNGLQLAEMVRARLPALPIILVSGYNDATPLQSATFRLLRKPLPADELAKAIRAELGTFPRIVVDNTRAG